jgi:hypothetical protein
MIAQKERELADLHTTISQSKYRNEGTFGGESINFTNDEIPESPTKIKIR